MKEKDLSVIKNHWESMDTVSLKDTNLQLLERDTIMAFLKKTKQTTLKDIGCGDGSDTLYFAQDFEKVYAYDYSNAMLTKASQTLAQTSNVTLQHLDVLQDDITPMTNAVITKRMLINLGNFENQKNAIQKIYDSLEDDGYYIMLETCTNGLENLNKLRALFNLESIPEPFHNTLFELEALKEFLTNYFIIEDVHYFSTYFFLTRVYSVTLEESNIFKYDKNAKEIADKGIELFGSEVIGPQFCMLLKKKTRTMLQNKVIVVSGGAGLIGQGFIEAICKNNGIAIIADVNEELMIKVQKHFQENLSYNVDIVSMDILNKESIQDALNLLDKKYGRIDAIVNNAYPRNKNFGDSFFDVTLDNFNENINMNLGGYFLTSQQFALYFKKQGYGNIINIASIYGVTAPNFDFYEGTNMIGVPIEYPAIKSALIHLTKYMAKYFKGLNIRVNAISPGGIFDNQDEKFLQKYQNKCITKGMLDKSDLGGTLVYLLSEMSQYVNGQNIIVDDGFTL